MTNPTVSKRAQELAAEIYRRCTMQDDAEMREWIEGLFQQYGREVREAAAEKYRSLRDEGWSVGAIEKSIREMDLP